MDIARDSSHYDLHASLCLQLTESMVRIATKRIEHTHTSRTHTHAISRAVNVSLGQEKLYKTRGYLLDAHKFGIAQRAPGMHQYEKLCERSRRESGNHLNTAKRIIESVHNSNIRCWQGSSWRLRTHMQK